MEIQQPYTLDDDSGYVPYTGATSNVNLGTHSLTAASITDTGLTSGSVLFAGASGVLSQDNSNLFWDATNHRLGIGTASPASKLDIADTSLAGSGSLAGSILNLAQTWNTTGTPTAIKLNVTNTASNAASLLMDLQVGGVSRFNVANTGATTILNSSTSAIALITQEAASATADIQQWRNSSSTPYSAILGAGAGGYAGSFVSYGNTYASGTNYARGRFGLNGNQFEMVTEHAGAATARDISIYADTGRALYFGSNGTQYQWYINSGNLNSATGALSTEGALSIGTTNTMSSFGLYGDQNIQNTGTLGSQTFTNPSLTSGTSWTAVGEGSLTSNTYVYTFVSGATTTLTQTQANLATPAVGNRYYSFTYTASAVSGFPKPQITTSFASTATYIGTNGNQITTAGTYTIVFKSAASPTDFVINFVNNGAGSVTLTNLSLKEVQGGNLVMGGIITGGGTNGLRITGTGNALLGTLTDVGSRLRVAYAPTSTSTLSTLSLGGGAFDGTTAGFFVGSASGTSLAVNEVSGYAGDLINAQVGGVSKFKVTNAGVGTFAGNLSTTGLLATGTYTGSYTDGIVADYTSGTGRISVGASDGISFYNGGVANTLLASISSGGNFITTAPLRLKGYTVGTLPTGTQGDTAFVTDALAPTFLGVLVGGGAIVCPAFYDGTNWVAK